MFLSVDWRADLAALRERLGPKITLQGKRGPRNSARAPRTKFARPQHGGGRVVENGAGHILNLGHGIFKQTPVEKCPAIYRDRATAGGGQSIHYGSKSSPASQSR